MKKTLCSVLILVFLMLAGQATAALPQQDGVSAVVPLPAEIGRELFNKLLVMPAGELFGVLFSYDKAKFKELPGMQVKSPPIYDKDFVKDLGGFAQLLAVGYITDNRLPSGFYWTIFYGPVSPTKIQVIVGCTTLPDKYTLGSFRSASAQFDSSLPKEALADKIIEQMVVLQQVVKDQLRQPLPVLK